MIDSDANYFTVISLEVQITYRCELTEFLPDVLSKGIKRSNSQ